MKLRLPKDLRGVVFPRVLTIVMAEFDSDLFLPALYFTILADGRGRGRRVKDPTAIGKYIDALANHPSLEGFTDPSGRRVLDRLVRTSLIKTGGVGRAKRGEQIMSTVPYSLLSHKPGFVSEGSRVRGVDTFIYHLLRTQLGADDHLRQFVKTVFGAGVTIGSLPALGGTYDGVAQLDTLTRVSIAFLDGFETSGVGGARRPAIRPACPLPAANIAKDLWRYLFAYHSLMPVQALTYYLQALVNLELFTYTLKLVHSVNELVRTPEQLPSAMQATPGSSPPEVYVDFTGAAGSLSQEMAGACVRRDLEAYQQFLASNLRLRLLHGYVETLRRAAARRQALDAILPPPDEGPLYLQGLLLLQHEPTQGAHLQASARVDEIRIRSENTNTDDEDDPTALAWLDALVDDAETDIDRVVNLLTAAHQREGLGNYAKWFSGSGGLAKPHGLLTGTAGSRQGWRYAPSNDLLAVLVQLAAARETTEGGGDAAPQPIRLQDFLTFLETRFGLIVDRPPTPFAGADYAAAARDNLRAMLDRLRQMGIFRDLSDDFTVQRLQPPYAGEPAARRRSAR